MPIPSNPSYLLDVIGSQADVFSIPETTPEGSGALSYASGWPKIVATALSAGGLPPQREYFNAVNKLLSQHIFFLQSGGVYPWNSALDYNPGARVMGSNGIVYVAVAASGPDVSEVGAQNPTTDSANTYWQTLAASLMSSSGGLVVDPETGQASVDFSQMPTDKFEALLKSIRVPIWLSGNKNFYVDVNSGSDILDDGRGESIEKPFKTIQAAVNYVADNYNLSNYRAIILVADGNYNEDIVLPSYSSVNGFIEIRGNYNNREAVTVEGFDLSKAVTYLITSITIKKTTPFVNYGGIFSIQIGSINVHDVCIDCTAIPESSSTFSGVWIRNGGLLSVIGVNSANPPTGVHVKIQNSKLSAAIALTAARVNFNADFYLEGDSSESFTCISLESLASASFVYSGNSYPGRKPVVVSDGTINGYKYNVKGNSILNTGGGGEDFFPGNKAGISSYGGQYM